MNFTLKKNFIEQYIGKQPKWGPVGYITYKRTYAREIKYLPLRLQILANEAELNKTEEFWLTLVRVVEGTYNIQKWHCDKNRIRWDDAKAQTSAQEMFKRMWEFKFLPPGRGLFMMGSGVEWKTSAVLQNCAFVTTRDIAVNFSEPFTFLMDMSMLGVGVGGDTLGAKTVEIKEPVRTSARLIIEDSREGWVEAVELVLDAFTTNDIQLPKFDYSLIRKEGIPLKTFGGTSSGPQPLIDLIESLDKLLTARANAKDNRITSTDIVDIFNLIGKCVVSGNVRRSSEILLGNQNDVDFLNLKNPEINAEALKNHRWASNNSISASPGHIDYSKFVTQIAANGEPGFFWLSNAQQYSRMMDPADDFDYRAVGTNPCSEQTLESFELCNLVETFPANHDTLKDWRDTLKYAYLYAKTVTLLPTHNYKTNEIMLRNRRIGLSMSGIVQAMNKFGRRIFLNQCTQGYDVIKALDNQYSSWFSIPNSIKVTSVKPSGTVSLLCGAWPGIHLPEAEHYYRVIRFNKTSWMLPWLEKQGFKTYDLSDSGEPNTIAVYFPVKEQYFTKSKKDVTMWEQLETAAALQYYWADNQVSCTVTFKPHEVQDMATALEFFETRLKSISFLPYQTHGYNHAPYQEISKETYEKEKVDISYDLESNGTEQLDAFCDSDRCYIPLKVEK